MHSIRPSSLSDRELMHYADMMLREGKLPVEWQEEILKRLEHLLFPATTAE